MLSATWSTTSASCWSRRASWMTLADWSRVVGFDHTDHTDHADHVVLDVREPAEVARGTIAGALFVPLHQLRSRLSELPRDKLLWVLCAVGQRAYVGQRILTQHGFDAAVLSGGTTTWRALWSTEQTNGTESGAGR
jgi:rhodanese-related sulfurtransferase